MSDIVMPVPPQTVRCPKCNRQVTVAVNPGKPGIDTNCKEQDCPIATDPNNQPFGGNGTLIHVHD